MMQKYAYIYRYDNQRRCIYRKLPGREPVYQVYDRTGACILTQDGSQRQRQEWTYTIPDRFGRPCISGVCRNSVSYASEPLHPVHVYAEYDGASTATGGYSVHNLTLVSQTMHSAAYYDGYSFIGHHGVPSSLSAAAVPGFPVDTSLGRGLQTGSATAVLGSAGVTGYTYSAMYYDSRYNVSQVRSTNHLGGSDVTLTSYSYTGKPLCVRKQHTASGSGMTVEDYAWTYDGRDRPLSLTHSVNGSTPVTLASYTYDTLGRVSTKTVGGLETTTYTYNVQSWATKISGQRFTERLCYNSSVEGLSPSRPHQYCWNGRIGAYSWQVSGEPRQRGYGLTYDGHGRLASANYGEGPALDAYYTIYDERAEYDVMGNPTWIFRKSPNTLENNRPSSPSDRLCLEYDGNRLVHVTDSVTTGHNYAGAFHFADGADETVEYEYDANGNMTKDLNRNISSIEYNLLNLPSMISFNDNSFISNTYSATGEKLSTVYGIRMAPVLSPLSSGETAEANDRDGGISGGGSGTPEPQAGQIRHYCGNVVYDMGVTRLLTGEGYVTFASDGTPQYHYYLRDHLGNVRVVMDQSGAVEQVNHYYAFGGLMRESSNPGVQPNKFGGKELDRSSGLDAYDFGARSYFADRMQWSTMDPLCEKYYDVTPYGYCHNDPVKYYDKSGNYPGDFFYSANEAAIDFGLTYNDNSIRDCKEYSSSIIFVRNEKGVLGYTYTVPNIGDFDSSTPSEAFGAEIAAFIHTHGASCFTHWGNEFSGIRDENGVLLSIEERKSQDTVSDIGLSNRTMLDNYVVTPNGSLQKYDPLTGEIIMISTNMPSDKTDMGRLNKISSEETKCIYEIDNLQFGQNINNGIYRFKYHFK